mgnify:CR=1 FL=1
MGRESGDLFSTGQGANTWRMKESLPTGWDCNSGDSPWASSEVCDC